STSDGPDPETLSTNLLGDLTDPESGRVGEHLDAGPQCAEQVGRGDDMDDSVLVGGGRVGGSSGSVTCARAAGALGPEGPGDSAPVVEQWGDFRIVRELGRGGMGVVYEAYQGSLNRHVALKLLPERGDLARFRREARAAGRLHHTYIVPVFGVGEHAGRHYY